MVLMFLWTGCEREYTSVFDLADNPKHSILSEDFELVSIDTRLEGDLTRSKRDTLDVIKLKIRNRNTSEITWDRRPNIKPGKTESVHHPVQLKCIEIRELIRGLSRISLRGK